MKKTILLVVLSVIANVAVAKQCSIEGESAGSGLIPGWQAHHRSSSLQTFVTLSNITNSDIRVTVTLFTQDGSSYLESTDAGTQLQGSNVNIAELISSNGTLVPANQSVTISILSAGIERFGYGRVEWKSDDCLDNAMTGVLFTHIDVSNRAVGTQIALNGGYPF